MPRRQLRLDAATNARLDVMAAETGRSASDIMRTALVNYLDVAS
ncbi:ribbon-helix-helix protein, CopG family [Cutibacterium acnes HL099PA1]|nr:ribbon-helix-helix protein, CopG family [Cutibacterium acnes HL099PA1]TKW70432.1 MAG: ribbon-helix-helix protein, CopG family [Cutibacterium acnes]TLG53194.1 ribbon-helix-helix protein, CopG family [Cutibacterium acnes]TMT70240.1 ribbon-helix-helix protein, CopG family [Cutibacterium acnes]